MVKTTVNLPLELKRRLEETARVRTCSQAAIVRAALEEYLGAQERPRPKLPLFASGQGSSADRVDELLAEGFGQD